MLTLKTDDIQLGAQATDKVSAIRQVAARLSAAGEGRRPGPGQWAGPRARLPAR